MAVKGKFVKIIIVPYRLILAIYLFIYVLGNGNSLVDFESILRDHVGGWGPYQYRYMFIFAVITLELSYVYYSPILFLYVPKQHWCSPPPELLNLTTSLPMDLYIPLEEEDNRTDFSKCLMYDVDFQTLTEVEDFYVQRI